MSRYIYTYIYICILYRVNPNPNPNLVAGKRGGWLFHEITIANIVWCMAYTRGVGGELYISQ